MGLDRKILLPDFVQTIKDLDTFSLDVIELGYQEINENDDPSGKKFPPAKFRNLYKNKFKTWRTLDLCGGPGVELFDLSILTDERECADIITNYGTIEHVEKEKGQYNCWVNTHNMLKINGLIIHALPISGSWEGHCRWYYTLDFFYNFEQYGYKITKLERTWHNLVFCKMIKTNDNKFMSYENFMDTVTFIGGKFTKSNNPKNIV
jgi:hypothetical protein